VGGVVVIFTDARQADEGIVVGPLNCTMLVTGTEPCWSIAANISGGTL
jgi:hypothetical protein